MDTAYIPLATSVDPDLLATSVDSDLLATSVDPDLDAYQCSLLWRCKSWFEYSLAALRSIKLFQTNSVDPDQTVQMCCMIWIYMVSLFDERVPWRKG
jgi:hypothetical protein